MLAEKVASQRNPVFGLKGWGKDDAQAEQVDEHNHCERRTDCRRPPRNSCHGTPTLRLIQAEHLRSNRLPRYYPNESSLDGHKSRLRQPVRPIVHVADGGLEVF
jgi:hypothetical protein